jgi:lysozyme family protein
VVLPVVTGEGHVVQDLPGRRDMLRWAVGGAAGIATGKGAFAQSRDPLAVIDQLKLPPELRALLPAKEIETVRTIAALLRMEQDANAKGLRASPLAFNDGSPLPEAPDSFYVAALPRLVSLIDRSEGVDEGIADRAGAMLADLNATQREVPEALQPQRIVPSRSMQFAALRDEYASMFASMQLRDDASEITRWALRAVQQFRGRYEAVGKVTGVPWYFIGAIHGLESSYNFKAHLHNGDFPLTSRTRQVPAGRPLVWLPPADWESSARDALKLLGFAGQSDWSLERTLYRLEAYNGFGYRRRGVPTPYLWCFSNHYERGKFVKDGAWNTNARSQQCGAATLLKMLVDAGAVQMASV